jgi:hypothetical protein
MLTRALDWIDEAAGGLIRLAYLLAGITAVAVYFGAGHLPAEAEAILNAVLPWALAFAIETHTYITARRVRSAWQDMQSATRDGPEWSRARDSLRVNIWILAALLAFSCWNQLNYLVETWTPPATAFSLPGWVAYVVRALIVPAAFMCAAFLAPSAAPVAAQVENEARSTLHDVFRIARRQRRKMIRAAERDGRDMTAALVELVDDPAARRIIAHAYGAIRPASVRVNPEASGKRRADAGDARQDAAPDGQASPQFTPAELVAAVTTPGAGGLTAYERALLATRPDYAERVAAGDSPVGHPVAPRPRSRRPRGEAIRLVDAPQWTPEANRILRHYKRTPNASVRALAAVAKVSDSTVKRWLPVVRARVASETQARMDAEARGTPSAGGLAVLDDLARMRAEGAEGADGEGAAVGE